MTNLRLIAVPFIAIAACAPRGGDDGKPAGATSQLPLGTVVKLTNGIFPPLGVGSEPAGFTRAGANTYFWAYTADEQYEPWRTDGTPQGTFLLRDIQPGVRSSCVGAFTPFNGSVYFRGFDLEHGLELWKSDGTSAGTRQVIDLCPF